MINLKSILKRNKYIIKGYSLVQAMFTLIAPKLGCKLVYRISTGKKLNLNTPLELREKLIWLKLNKYIEDPNVIRCTDKILVRDYIAEKGYKEFLPTLIGIYDRVEDINWNLLPEKFALKLNNGCGYNVIVKNKSEIDKDEVINKFKIWINSKYGYKSIEPHYLKIKNRILCEEYIEFEGEKGLIDYKILCFNAKAKYILICYDRNKKLKLQLRDLDWNIVGFLKEEYISEFNIPRPISLDKMVEIAECLSQPFEFVRVDFYEYNKKPLIGEMTFTPAACMMSYITEEGHKVLGKLLELNI